MEGKFVDRETAIKKYLSHMPIDATDYKVKDMNVLLRGRNKKIGRVGTALFGAALAGAALIAGFSIGRISNESTVITSNWSGSYTQGTGLSSVSASWTVPAVSSTKPGVSSSWIGIGGKNGTKKLIQEGTEQDCFNGQAASGLNFASDGEAQKCKPNYYMWFATVSDSRGRSDLISIINPGDLINAQIHKVGNNTWLFEMSDVSQNIVFSREIKFSPDQTTAEAVVERTDVKVIGQSDASLADFGVVNFLNVSAASGRTAYYSPADYGKIVMIGNSGVIASPSKMDANGSFGVTWEGSN